MPVIKCPNGKYRIGKGKCIYDTKEMAEKAYAGYRAKKHMEENDEVLENGLFEILGGRGSGNYGHAGRPGKKGGSSTKGSRRKAAKEIKAKESKLTEVVKGYKERYIVKSEMKKKAPPKAIQYNKEVGAYEGMRRAFIQRATPLRGKAFRATIRACIGFQNMANDAATKRDRILGRVA